MNNNYQLIDTLVSENAKELQLTGEEWERLGFFNDLLGVRLQSIISNTFTDICNNSMPITRNMYSHQVVGRQFTLPYPRSRCCSRHGLPD